MPAPATVPIGLQLARSARAVSRAFDQALAVAGGSLPVWLVLLSLRTQALGTQRELAEAVGIREATLTHHLTAMEDDGLVTRRRHDSNRRVQVVELTPEGIRLFDRLRTAAVEFDRRLRAGVSDGDVARLGALLSRLVENVAAG
ncbi:MAG TPA: MarR family transcriptional regulator [Acidimicrobiales bacterium]|jgi:MarR family transcriptional regulator for hemolysin